MRINLNTLRFISTFLPRGTELYRCVANNDYSFQPSNSSLIYEGRFNKVNEYCFYLANSRDAAIYELISHYENTTPATIYLKKYQLTADISLIDLVRWTYVNDLTDRIEYSQEHIVINQHITCPKRIWSHWLYNQTQTIATYIKNNGELGIRYQTAIAHLITSANHIYLDPRSLFNYAIFKNNIECASLFTCINSEPIRTSNYSQQYLSLIDDNTVQRNIKCKNINETVSGVIIGNPLEINEYFPPVA